MQMSEGRTPEPLEGTIFNSFIDWLRLCLMTLSMLGLVYVLFESMAEEGRNTRALDTKQNQ